MQFRGAQLRAFQGLARVEVVGVLLERLGVLHDRPVVVVGTLGRAPVAKRAAGGAAGGERRRHDQPRHRSHDASGDDVSGLHR